MKIDYHHKLGKLLAQHNDTIGGARYLNISSENGNAYATNDLAVVFEYGGNYDLAFHCYCEAAKQGVIVSFYNLGNCFEKGYGTDINYRQALRYYKIAAERGYTPAYKKIAQFYKEGLGVKQNLKKELYYLRKGSSLEKDNNYAENECTSALAYLYSAGNSVVKPNIKKAYTLWHILASRGDINAKYNLAICQLYGEYCKPDIDTAVDTLIDLAIVDKYGHACASLFDIFNNSEYAPADLDVAGKFLNTGACAHDPYCIINISKIILEKKTDIYNVSPNVFQKSIIDFLTYVGDDNKCCLDIYAQLKNDFPDVDWEGLENRHKYGDESNNITA